MQENINVHKRLLNPSQCFPQIRSLIKGVLSKLDIINKMIKQQKSISVFPLLLKFDGKIWHGHLKSILFGLEMF